MRTAKGYHCGGSGSGCDDHMPWSSMAEQATDNTVVNNIILRTVEKVESARVCFSSKHSSLDDEYIVLEIKYIT